MAKKTHHLASEPPLAKRWKGEPKESEGKGGKDEVTEEDEGIARKRIKRTENN